MVTEEMTIHKALSELKVIDNRIQKEIGDATFVVANKHANTVIKGIPVADFVGQAKDKFKSIRSMISRRNAIKRAVTRSNAVTKVSIGGQEYTVAEAIDMKNLGMEHLKYLCSAVETQFNAARMAADRANGETLESRADTYIQSLYQNADKKNLSDEVKKVREDFMTAQTVEVIDPLDTTKVSKDLRDQIDTFMSEVDSALSVSNALTKVVVEYETY